MTKRQRTFLAPILLVILVLPFAISSIEQAIKTASLHRAFTAERKALLPSIEAVGQDSESENRKSCMWSDKSFLQTKAYCEDHSVFRYRHSADATTIEKVYAHAKELDANLAAHGWTIDRPQDRYKTTADVARYAHESTFTFDTGAEVPYHKNIGDVSCNLRLWYSGPQNGGKIPVANVNQFSCQKHIRYFAPNFVTGHRVLI